MIMIRLTSNILLLRINLFKFKSANIHGICYCSGTIIRGCFGLSNVILKLVLSLVNTISFYSSAGLSQMTSFLPDFYIYFIILISTLFFVFFVLFLNFRRKQQIFNQVYRKLSDTDKQVFHVVRATEKKTKPTLQNIVSVFYNITDQKIDANQLLQRLYRLENAGLVNISIANWRNQDVQICKTLYSDHSIADLLSKRYRLFTGIFLPLSIISLSICYYLLQFIDLIVHGDLYGYGLLFSYEWANRYWNITASIRSSLNIMFFLLGISLILTVANFHRFKKVLKITSCAIFIIGIAPVAYSLFLLSQLDLIINKDLYNFGLQFASQWAEQYWVYVSLLYILFVLSIGAILVCFIFCSYSKSLNHET